MPDTDKRKTTERITMRMTPVERALVEAAVNRSAEPWRGISHHVRQVILKWAMEKESKRKNPPGWNARQMKRRHGRTGYNARVGGRS